MEVKCSSIKALLFNNRPEHVKAQGSTLDAGDVHCAQEFVPDQTCVALSRVTNVASIEVMNFKRNYLLPLHEKMKIITTSDASKVVLEQGLSCCKSKILDDKMFM